MDVIDIHPHIISADRERYPITPLGGVLSDWVRDRPATCEQYIEQIEAAGFRRAVIVHSSMSYAYNCEYAAASAAAHPERFTWVAGVDILAPETADLLTRLVRERGLAGIRIFLAGHSLSPEWDTQIDDPRAYPAWERAQELGLSMKVQTRFRALARVRAMIERFPGVKVVIDHLARPPMEDGPPYASAQPFFDLARYPNVYLNIGDANFREAARGSSTPRAFFERLVDAFGAGHIMWGSNYPSSAGSVKDLLDLAQRELAFLPDSDRAEIFAGTALRVYPALPAAAT